MRRLLAFSVAFIALIAAGFLWTRDRPVAEAQTALPPAAAPMSYSNASPLPSAPKSPLTPEQREARRFNRYDKDKDDLIDRAEYLVNRQKAFVKADANGDGRLDFEEFAVTTSRKFKKTDRNGDGHLGREEFATTAVKRRAPEKAAPCKCEAED